MSKRKSKYRHSQKGKTSGRNPWNSLLSIIFGFLAIYGAVHLGLWSLKTSYFNVSGVEISGLKYAVEDSVRSKLRETLGKNLLKIDLEQLEDSLETIPFVKQVRVFRSLPSILRVEITEKELLAIYNSGRELIAVGFDGGFAARPGLKDFYDLPIITGIPAQSREYHNAIDFLRAAKTLSPVIYYKISEITNFLNTTTILLGEKALPVKIGTGNHHDKMLKLWALLNKPEIPTGQMLYADVRFPQKIYFKRG